MTNTTPELLTKEEWQRAGSADRERLLEKYTIHVLTSLLQPSGTPIEPESHLADLAVDSLQAVELKYSLDELLGNESDVDLFISNPTIRHLAAELVRRAEL